MSAYTITPRKRGADEHVICQLCEGGVRGDKRTATVIVTFLDRKEPELQVPLCPKCAKWWQRAWDGARGGQDVKQLERRAA